MEALEFAEFFTGIKPFSTVVHVFGAVCAMGAALVSDVLFTFYAADRRLSRMEVRTLAILSRIVWYGLLIIAVSGAAIFLSDPERYLVSSKFLAKMTSTAVLVINGAVLGAFVSPHLMHAGFLTARREALVRHVAFACGAVSVISWVSVLTLGVLDGVRSSYGSLMGMYGIVLAIGIVSSLLAGTFAFGRKPIAR